MFVYSVFSRPFYPPIPVKERVVVDETFFTRDLVYAINRSTRCWVLALSEQPVSLFDGMRENLVEIRAAGFPCTHAGMGGESSLPGKQKCVNPRVTMNTTANSSARWTIPLSHFCGMIRSR